MKKQANEKIVLNPPKITSIVVVTSVHPMFDGRIWKHCKSLARHGVTVHLICPWDVPAGVGSGGVIFYPFRRARGILERFALVPRRINRHLEKLVPIVDVLHIHDPDLLWLAKNYSHKMATIYDCHENYDEQIKLRPYVPKMLKPLASSIVAKIERSLTRRVGNVVLAAPSQGDYFKIPGVRSLLVGNLASVDLLDSVSENWSDRSPAIVFIGTQHERNGSLVFLRAAALLAKRYPSLRFIASDRFPSADFRAEYLALASKFNILDRLDLPANVPAHRIMEILNRGTIAINPNLRIPQQMRGNQTKLYEFMAAGLPLVTSDLPHQKKLVEECESGLVAQPEAPQSFADQIGRILDDDAFRLRLGRNAKQAFREKYCYEQQMPALLDFYASAMALHVDKHKK